MKTANTKPWYASKTLWVNLVAVVAIIIQSQTGQDMIGPEEQVAILAVINLILRAVTHQGLTLSSTDQSDQPSPQAKQAEE